MKHKMNLEHEPFSLTKLGDKKIEIRLNDEKRREINIGDKIEFKDLKYGELLRVIVLDVRYYNTMEILMESEQFHKTGGLYTSKKNWKENIDRYYSKELQKKIGFIVIEIALDI